LNVNNGVLFVSASGNVGIGTTTPDRPLDIYSSTVLGIARIRGNNSNGVALTIQNDQNAQGISIYAAGTSGFGLSGWAGNTALESETGFVYSAYSGSHIFQNGNRAERMRITSAGNVGIGTSSPDNKIGILGANNSTPQSDGISIYANNTTVFTKYGWGGLSAEYDYLFYTAGSERMRITSGGEVLMHNTTYNSTVDGQLFGTGGETYITKNGGGVLFLNRRTSDGIILQFEKNTVSVGSISTNTYSLPSDLNFKKNINNLDLGLNLVDKLRPVSYNHKIDDEGSALSTGFIAQELEQSLTELGVNKNEYYILQHKPNEDKSQSQYWLDYTKMIAILTKAIQELSAKNTALEEILQRNNIQ
jgi:hypothetical protein